MTLPGVHPLRRMVAEADFRRLLRVRLGGQAGDGLFQGALFGAAFFNPEKATSAAAAASAFATVLLPYSLVGPFAGVLIDRWSRQRVLMVSNGLRAALCAVFALSLWRTGAISVPSVGVALLLVSLNRFVLSALSASLPHVVETRDLVTANALTTTAGQAATAVGGISSLGLRALWGSDDGAAARTALAAALVYAVTCLLASRIARRRLGPEQAHEPAAMREALLDVARGLVEGARHLRSRAPAARALATITAQRFLTGVMFVGTLLLYTEHGYLHRGFTGLGEVLTATVVGGVVAASITPRVTRAIGTQRWISVVLLAAAVATIGLGPAYTHPALVTAGLLLGTCSQAAKICVDTLLQESVDDAFRGRVFSVYDTMVNVSFAAAAGVAAVVVPDDGRSIGVLVVLAAGYAVTGVVYGWVVRRRMPYEPPEPVVTAR
jgi:MFS family permease